MECVAPWRAACGSRRNKRRSALTILSIGGSLCLLGVLLALYFSFFHSETSPAQALRLVVRNRISLANPLPLAYRERIKQVPGVEEVTIFQWYGGTYKDNRDTSNQFGRFAMAPADKIKAGDWKSIEALAREAATLGR